MELHAISRRYEARVQTCQKDGFQYLPYNALPNVCRLMYTETGWSLKTKKPWEALCWTASGREKTALEHSQHPDQPCLSRCPFLQLLRLFTASKHPLGRIHGSVKFRASCELVVTRELLLAPERKILASKDWIPQTVRRLSLPCKR